MVLAVVACLYIKQGLSYLSTRSEAEKQLAIVQRLLHANAVLVQRRKSLSDPATIQRDARALGMVRAGERPYVITGLSNH